MYWPVGSPSAFASTLRAPTDVAVLHRDADGDSETNTSDCVSGSAPDDSLTNGPANAGSSTNEDGGNRDEIVAVEVSRGGNVFATITTSGLTIWQSKPTVALAAVRRSKQSMQAYGANVGLTLRPDALEVAIYTEQGFLISYTLATDPSTRVYRTVLPESTRHMRSDSRDGYSSFRRPAPGIRGIGVGEADGAREVHLLFRMVIRIDAGINQVLAMDNELVVATRNPPAIQSIRWLNDQSGAPQTTTELLSKLPWLRKDVEIVQIIHERSMNLTCWITTDGCAYAVQRVANPRKDGQMPKLAYHGIRFHDAESDQDSGTRIAINARFSLIALGCRDGSIHIYNVKDYAGNIPPSHKLVPEVASRAFGLLTFLSYSPDGCCLFVGYEHGWAMWSTYGKSGASSIGVDVDLSTRYGEKWLLGARAGFWLGGGCAFAIVASNDHRIWIMDMARTAAAGSALPANIARGLLGSSESISLYRAHSVTDLTAIPADTGVWHTLTVPPTYLAGQWPIRSAAVSDDGRYVAVAGLRGLAHYSLASGRWKTFDDPQAEQEFVVRGGMCWHQHFLIASVQTGTKAEIRIFSREKALAYSQAVHSVELEAPAILITPSGTDSLLVYTNDNTLRHFIFAPDGSAIRLVHAGQIGLHGIIRAPARVRSISWILTENQLEYGDPSQDIVTASALFLVDAKLVLLIPSSNGKGELKYDMRVIAQNVEYYTLQRDQPVAREQLTTPSQDFKTGTMQPSVGLEHSLRDSLWYFDGEALNVWSDVQDVLNSAPIELGREVPAAVRIPIDFYPTSVLVAQGIIHGCDVDLIQRRDVGFAFFRQVNRTQLFLPKLLLHHLAEFNAPAALHLANSYQHLPYFGHALEILLHDVLDTEVDTPPASPETALLPSVVSLISSYPVFLDVVVNCTRKTELRSWKTLFAHLPPALELFEQSLQQDKLKTAAGYLLVLHTLASHDFQVYEFARLLSRAASQQEWELCRELARFLTGIDATGRTLRLALSEAGLTSPAAEIDCGNERYKDLGISVGTSELSSVKARGVDYFTR